MTEDTFDIGLIVNVHGLKGEIKVLPTTDDPMRFKLLKTINVYNGEQKTAYKPGSVRAQKNMLIIKLKEINDRDEAAKLVGGVIKVARSEALPLDEDEYYQKDLLDMKVITETGEVLGNLSQIIETGANDVYVVKEAGKKKDILIPAIRECIISVSVKEKLMTVKLLDGLLDL